MEDTTYTIHEIPIDQIDPPIRPARFTIDPERIEELAKSISEIGLLQPILLRPSNGRYEIIAGHRRYLAFRRLGKDKIPARVVTTEDTACIIARATENLARHDLTPIEEGQIYYELVHQYGMSVETIAKKLGKSPGTIQHRIDLLEMPECLQKAVHERKISQTVAEELWRLKDESAISYYLEFCVEHGATKAVVRGWVDDYLKAKRQEQYAGTVSSPLANPFLDKPVYVSCDLCTGPTRLGDEVVMRVCPDCVRALKKLLEQGG